IPGVRGPHAGPRPARDGAADRRAPRLPDPRRGPGQAHRRLLAGHEEEARARGRAHPQPEGAVPGRAAERHRPRVRPRGHGPPPAPHPERRHPLLHLPRAPRRGAALRRGRGDRPRPDRGPGHARGDPRPARGGPGCEPRGRLPEAGRGGRRACGPHVDRLIALVLLRWRMDLRSILGARERAVGLLFLAPSLALGSLVASAFVFAGIRALDRTHPELVLPGLSVAATVVGTFWVLSPLLAGVAFSETHDVSRLLHFPIPFPTLVLSSLLANLAEPMVLAKLPLHPLGAAVAPAGAPLSSPAILAVSQVGGLVLLGLARNRRLHDAALFLRLGLGFLLSFVPLFLFAGGGRGWTRALRWLVATDLFALSPFAWGVRASVHVARGGLSGFLASSGAAVAGLVLG